MLDSGIICFQTKEALRGQKILNSHSCHTGETSQGRITKNVFTEAVGKKS